MKGIATPTPQSEILYRPRDPLQMFDNLVINSTSEVLSEDVECKAFRHFGLFVFIDSTGSPTDLRIKIQFLDRWTGRWYTHKQGLFASLYYEDADTASGISECFQGMCLGRAMRVTLTGSGTSAQAYFTVSIGVDFWN